MNREKYCKVVEHGLFHLWEPFWSFLQDNASIHKRKYTMDWFQENGWVLKDYPALSPDLNPIKNLWAIMANKVYKGGKRKFRTKDPLLTEITRVWNKI